MASVIKETKFLSAKVASHDLILVEVMCSPRSQVLRARVEHIYSARKGIDPQFLGTEIEFVRSPSNWGDVALMLGERALIFVASISGQLYEDPWHGHMIVEKIDGNTYASFPHPELWLNDKVPALIRACSRKDPKRPYATAIRFDAIEAYLSGLISEFDRDRQ